MNPDSAPANDEAADELVAGLVEAYSRPLYRQAVAILGDHALAEDVVQESIIRAWLAHDTFRGDGSKASWVLRIGHNVAISALRRRREELREPSLLPDPGTEAADDSVADRMAVDEVWEIMDNLDPMSRAIVILRDVEGLSYTEIAEITGTSLATVKTRLFRTRRELADRLRAWK